jgi:hypothetical protein
VVVTVKVPVGSTLAGAAEVVVAAVVLVVAAEVVVVLALLLQEVRIMTATTRRLRHRNRTENLCFFK